MARGLLSAAMKALLPLASLVSFSALPAQIFAPPQSQPLPIPLAPIFDLAIADLDGDGILDGVLRETATVLSSPIRQFRGDGSGGFVLSPQMVGSSLFASRDLVLADLDGDGAVDLLAPGAGVLRLRNDGSGVFTAWPLPQTVPLPTVAACIGDFDGDRQADLMLRVGNDLGLMLADGAGGFGAVELLAQTLGAGNGVLNAADVDGDGDVDVVVGPSTSSTYRWVRNDGSGSFAVLPIPAAFTVAFPNSSSLVDIDGDHLPDLVVCGGSGGLALHRNLGGAFAFTPVVFPTATDLAAADVDGDGALELVVVDATGVKVLRAAGTGYAVLETHPVGASGQLALGDFDGDGAPDLLVGSSNGLHVLRNQQPTPSGVSRYGVGTPSCRGSIGMRTAQSPTLGSQLRVLCSNAPASGTGLLAMGTRVTNGWDPLGLDLVFHLGLAFQVGSMVSDAGGVGQATLSLPSSPFLAGLRVHLQSFWLADAGSGDTCSPAYMDFVSSRGLSLRLMQ